MIKYLFVFFLHFVALTSVCQISRGNEIIADGAASLKLKPDQALFRLEISKKDTSEHKAITKLNKEIDLLTRMLLRLGFTEKNTKVAEFDISSSENDNNVKTYEVANSLNVRFPLDTRLINAFYKEVESTQLTDLDIKFNVYVSDSLEKATRKTLIQLAIEDAKQNAKNISTALQIEITGIKQVVRNRFSEHNNIVDQWEIVNYAPPRTAGATKLVYHTSFDKFQVEEISIEENITIVFEIAKKNN